MPDLTIEILEDRDAANPRKDYDHLGTLALTQEIHIADETIEDREAWLLDALPTVVQDKLEHLDELIEQVRDHHQWIWDACVKTDPDQRPEGLFTEKDARIDALLLEMTRIRLALRQGDLWERIVDVMGQSKLLPSYLQKICSETYPANALEAHRKEVAFRRIQRTSKRLDALTETRKRVLETELNETLIALAVDVYQHNEYVVKASPAGFDQSYEPDGYIYVTWDQARKEFSGTDEEVKAKALACLNSELEEYSQYLSGEVYGYVITDEDGETLDSCWGFYGREYCEGEANAAAEAIRQSLPEQMRLPV